MVRTNLRLVSLASWGRIDERSGDRWSERPSRKSVGSCQIPAKRVGGDCRSAKNLQDGRTECPAKRLISGAVRTALGSGTHLNGSTRSSFWYGVQTAVVNTSWNRVSAAMRCRFASSKENESSAGTSAGGEPGSAGTPMVPAG